MDAISFYTDTHGVCATIVAVINGTDSTPNALAWPDENGKLFISDSMLQILNYLIKHPEENEEPNYEDF